MTGEMAAMIMMGGSSPQPVTVSDWVNAEALASVDLTSDGKWTIDLIMIDGGSQTTTSWSDADTGESGSGWRSKPKLPETFVYEGGTIPNWLFDYKSYKKICVRFNRNEVPMFCCYNSTGSRQSIVYSPSYYTIYNHQDYYHYSLSGDDIAQRIYEVQNEIYSLPTFTEITINKKTNYLQLSARYTYNVSGTTEQTYTGSLSVSIYPTGRDIYNTCDIWINGQYLYDFANVIEEFSRDVGAELGE